MIRKRIIQCREWLHATKRRRLIYRTVLTLAISVLLLDFVFPLPQPGRDSPAAVVVVARDGTPLRAFPDRQHVWRHTMTLEEVSPLYLEALVNYEDRAFWWHPGVNPYALMRAAWQWVSAGHIVSGGSTLTMQVARIIDPTPRTVLGKFRQILRALQLELHYSKREILTMYVNYVPMGGVLEGVEAASRAYLGKPSFRLTHSEAAMLTVLPQSPSLLRPDRFPERARASRDKVLKRMTDRWGKEVCDDALMEAVYGHAVREPLLAPLLAQRLRPLMKNRGRIDTTIDANIQSTVELLLADRARALPPKVSLAALVIDNNTLEVLAYAGSADFSDDQRFAHVDMVRASRSPGSTLKPFLYGLALDEGLIHSESLLADAPQSFSGYQPGNFQQSFHGAVSVSEALVKSLNVPAVEVLERLEPNRFVAQLRRGGLKLDMPRGATPNLSVILGGAGTSLENLTGAYASLARKGLAGKPRLLPEQPLEETRMMSEGAAYIVRDILESGGPIGRATESGANSRQGVVWKTGTSFGFRDAWAVGVSESYTIGIWVGRPDGTPNPGFFGANVAAPLLVDIYSALPQASADAVAATQRTPPPSVTQAQICWPLGLRADDANAPYCHQKRTAWLLNDLAPATFPDRLRSGDPRISYFVDPKSGKRVLPECAKHPPERIETARWPAVLEPWLDGGVRQKALPPEWDAACASSQRPEAEIRIVGLTDGAILRKAGNQDVLLVRLDVRGTQGEVIWMVNGRVIVRNKASVGLVHAIREPGRYDITLLDDYGHFDRISFSVR
jgi:penicillin-binding protein 1C